MINSTQLKFLTSSQYYISIFSHKEDMKCAHEAIFQYSPHERRDCTLLLPRLLNRICPIDVKQILFHYFAENL